jgi:hypothetical protein
MDMSDKARLERAKQLGFTIPAYHGTAASFNAFDPAKGRENGAQGHAPYFADKHEEAHGYASKIDKGRVMDCLLRVRKPLMVPAREMGEYPARKERIIPLKLYRAITGGKAPKDSRREMEQTVVDALRHAQSEMGSEDRRANWNTIYKRLRDLGFDAMVFLDTPSDFQNGTYTKLVMLDMSGIRLTSAAFDPAKADTISLTA